MTKSDASAPAPKKGTRMTPKQWAEAEALWEAGDVTLDELARRFSKDKSILSRHFKNHGIVKGAAKEEHKRKVAEEVTRQAQEEAAVLAARIRMTKEEHYKMAEALAKLTWKEVLEVNKTGRPMSTALNNLKALDSAMTVLKKAREERYAVLGLDRTDFVDDSALPELVISELTNEQIEAMRDRQEDDDTSLPELSEEGELPDEDDVVEEDDEVVEA
ncbi:hypothetical protein [Cupriavidus campinensis]|uniref:hypothetical protein n=1 Tax=Cupriavidus campinensis TaxID=151783 RepID=UPI001642C223|nr:hypothetical protein [Cupriavidus campinensis]